VPPMMKAMPLPLETPAVYKPIARPMRSGGK
jgi:hypothetical protein